MSTCNESHCGYDSYAQCTTCHRRKCGYHLKTKGGYRQVLYLSAPKAHEGLDLLNPVLQQLPNYREVAGLAEAAFDAWYDPAGTPQCTACLAPRVEELTETLRLIPIQRQERIDAERAARDRANREKFERDRATDARLRKEFIAFARTSIGKQMSEGVFKRRWYLGEKTFTSHSASEYHGYPVTSSKRRMYVYADGSLSDAGSLHDYEAILTRWLSAAGVGVRRRPGSGRTTGSRRP